MSGYILSFAVLSVLIFLVYREYPVTVEGTMYLPVFEYDETHPDVDDPIEYMMEHQSTPDNTSIPGTFRIKRYRIDSVIELDYATIYHLSSGAQIVVEGELLAEDFKTIHTSDLARLLDVEESDLISNTRKGAQTRGEYWGHFALYTDTGKISSFRLPNEKLNELRQGL